jgi:hypothetical protein
MVSAWEERGGGSLFLSLLRNILSCYFLSAFEFTLPPVPFIGVGWIPAVHSEGPLPLHLVFSSGKDQPQRTQVWGGEISVLPRLPFPQSRELIYTIGYAIWYPADVLHPWEFSLALHLSIHLQTVWCFKTSHYFSFGELVSVLRHFAWDVERGSSPMKLASLNNFCVRRKQRIFQIQLDMPQREK